MKKYFFISLIIFFLQPLCYVYAEELWDLIKDDDGTQIFIRPAEGYRYGEIMAVTTVDSKMEAVTDLLSDISAAGKWIDRVEEIKIIKIIDEANAIIYISIDSPWPVKNRDVIVKTTLMFQDDPRTVIIDTQGVREPVVPERNGYVRITQMSSRWVIESISQENRKTRIKYSFKSDPGGWIPEFLAKMSIRNQPASTLKALKKMVRDLKYSDPPERSELSKEAEKRFQKIKTDSIMEKEQN